MRVLVQLLLLLATAMGLAVASRFNAGNVVLFYPPYRIDLSLNFFILLSVIVVFLLYQLTNTLRITREMPRRASLYRVQRREREGNQAFRDALKALFEGRFGHAEKLAQRAADVPENVGLAALIGARSAHWMRQFDRRDAWLTQAAALPALKPARLMTALELCVDEHHADKALAAVEELNASGTRHIQALRLALKANQQAKRWPEVLRLTRLLDKHNALHPALSTRLHELAYADMLSKHPHDAESLRKLWKTVPTVDRLRGFVASKAANAFNDIGLHDEARLIIETAMASHWDERLIRSYRLCAAPEGSSALLAQIEQCEIWSSQKPSDAQLTLTLGALCLKQKLWGKAQRHLEHALSQASDAATLRDVHCFLGQLHEALAQHEQSALHYRECALLS